MAINVYIERNRFGDLELWPQSELWIKAFALHMAVASGSEWGGGAIVYLQGQAADEFMESGDEQGPLPPKAKRALKNGWTVTVRMDPTTFGNLLGYDAHLVADIGPRASIAHDKEELRQRSRAARPPK